MAEDVFLVSLAALTCYTLLMDYKFYKEGQFLLVDDNGHAKSCKSRFLRYFPVDDFCRDLVAACHEHASDTFRLGDERKELVGALVSSFIIIFFKQATVFYERRMGLV